ncbi:MAG: glutathione S-transferase [Boseongicola sp.]|nr:glutathione S-transferase [Boseongicola sp.]MDD9976949.1 glutathione S-transferase [Boseongicola sp.]
MTRPILYSFRRCPYAMRARLAIASANIECELREIVLRDKAPEFVAASPKATVPVLIDGDTVLEESLDIMLWALHQNDLESWLQMPQEGHDLIATMTEQGGPFKSALDHYKYASRYADIDASAERDRASIHLSSIESQLVDQKWLFGENPSLADMAILTFIRQFAHVDLDWFNRQPWPNVQRWLEDFKSSDRFRNVMQKYPKWQNGDPVTLFPQ